MGDGERRGAVKNAANRAVKGRAGRVGSEESALRKGGVAVNIQSFTMYGAESRSGVMYSGNNELGRDWQERNAAHSGLLPAHQTPSPRWTL